MMSCQLLLAAAVAMSCVGSSMQFSSSFVSGMAAKGGRTPSLRQPKSIGPVMQRITSLGLETDPSPLPSQDQLSRDAILGKLRTGNKRWIQENKNRDPAFFDKLGTTHTPEVMWIGCADSRVAANEIIDMPAGSVFVHRNIANCILKDDINLMSGLQYAVDYLEVKHIIVCGHYSCGGVAASLDPYCVASPLQNWLGHIVNVQRLHQGEIESITDIGEKQRRLVELHAMEQAKNVYELEIVQERLADNLEDVENFVGGKEFPMPRITCVVYDVGTGQLKRLNWWKLMGNEEDIYGHSIDENV